MKIYDFIINILRHYKKRRIYTLRNRKSDKYRFKEKRGIGRQKNYKPWILPHEFGSEGRSHRLLGWIIRRMYSLLSDGEFYCFLLLQWEEGIIDIREQYPLLPLECTELIAEELGIVHPPKKRKKKTVMTTDIVATLWDQEKGVRDVAIAVKTADQLQNPRTLEKLKIEEEYWKRKGVKFVIVTENDIDRIKAINIAFIYRQYFWQEDKHFSEMKISDMFNMLKKQVQEKGVNLIDALRSIEKQYDLEEGEGCNFLYYLITHKKVEVDLSKKLSLTNLIIKFVD